MIKKFRERGSTENSQRPGGGHVWSKIGTIGSWKDSWKMTEGHLLAKLPQNLMSIETDGWVQEQWEENWNYITWGGVFIGRGWWWKRSTGKTQFLGAGGRGGEMWINFWKNVIFSDESQVYIGEDQHIYVWRKPEEGWRPDLIKRRDQCPVKVMVWGCIHVYVLMV